MARLIKFCRPEHRLPGMDRIVIGTLYAYRGIEEGLPEGTEGQYEFEIEVRGPLTVPADAHALLTQPAAPGLPGDTSITLDKIEAKPNPDGSWTIQRATGHVRRNVANVFVFTMCHGAPAMVSPWRDYTASWQVPEEMAEPLARALSKELERDVRAAMRGPAPVMNPTGPKPVVRYTAGPMIYGKRRMVFDAKSPLTADSLKRELFRMPFVKPSALAGEREVRFIFECLVGKRVYAPGRDGLFVASAPLAPLLVQ